MLGSGLRGGIEGNTGNFTNSTVGSPIVQVMGPMSSSGAYLDTSAAVEVLTFRSEFTANGSQVDVDIPLATQVGRGYYQLRVVVGGIASEAWIIHLP